ncbi:unnamed protein product [Effrenium voratum]|uniref:Uncharacterized protein n=1 Tax=Effrenium voratum TaxID=2562239 RepID=A0AA36NLW9_9DINO|nr:unnamed protein product [Effrenium voratum]
MWRVDEWSRGPKLPWQWFATSLTLQCAGLAAQLLAGWTVLAGCILFAYYAGFEMMCHLFYYSGSVTVNSSTALPSLSMAGLILCFVMSGNGISYGYMELGRWGGVFWVLVSGVAGFFLAKGFLVYLGVEPRSCADASPKSSGGNYASTSQAA